MKLPLTGNISGESPSPESAIVIYLLILHSVVNAETSINSALDRNAKLVQGNVDALDISKLQTLGAKVENKDPLPENCPNVGMNHQAAAAVGNWIFQLFVHAFKKTAEMSMHISQQCHGK